MDFFHASQIPEDVNVGECRESKGKVRTEDNCRPATGGKPGERRLKLA